MSAAMPFRKRERIGGRVGADWIEERPGVFGGRKRESRTVRGGVTGSTGGVVGFERNRDEKISGIGGMSAAVPPMKRETRRRACAT
jgi:hypothetical protein